MITYKNYYLKGQSKKEFFDWCIESKLHKRTTLEFSSRMQLVFTGFIETESITAVVAFNNKEVAGILLCENRITYSKGKVYIDPMKFSPVEQQVMDWGFYNMGMLNIYVKNKFRKQGIAKQMVENVEKLRLNKLSTINETHWYENSKPVFEARELAFEICGKYFKNSYVSTVRPEDKFSYRQVVHSLSVKCLDKLGCKQFNREDFKNIDLQIEEIFVKTVKTQRIKKII